jgi:hypothetical protein
MPNSALQEVARHFAPIFAQKVTLEWKAADQLAPLTYAGALVDVADNVRKLLDHVHDPEYEIPDPPAVYFSGCETTTHYFLLYAVYHVFDWWKRLPPDNLYDLIRDQLDEHAHDVEGALVVVRKAPQATADALVTVAHDNFYLHTEPQRPSGSDAPGEPAQNDSRPLRVAKFNESVDGRIWLDHETRRIKLYVESRGHGIHGDHRQWGPGDQVWYYRPSGEAGNPARLNDQDETRVIDYELVDLFEDGGVWYHRFDPRVFLQQPEGKWGLVCYSRLTSGARDRPSKANPPWSWNDHNDTSPIGEIATDPATFITRYAQGWGPVSRQYLVNPYMAIGQ